MVPALKPTGIEQPTSLLANGLSLLHRGHCIQSACRIGMLKLLNLRFVFFFFFGGYGREVGMREKIKEKVFDSCQGMQ